MRIDFNIDDTPASISALIRRIGIAEIESDESADTVVLDLESCRYLGPAAVTCLAGVHSRLAEAGRRVEFVPPRLNRLRGYCEWSGLLAHMQAGRDPIDHPDSVTTALRNFSTYDLEGMNEVVGLVRRFVDLSDDTEQILRTCMSELVQNILDHADSSVGGFLSARAFSGRREVRFAICDMGMGIPVHVRRRHSEFSTDEDCLRFAMSERGTASTRRRNQGLGLYHLDEIVEANGGSLAIMSGAVRASRAGDGGLSFGPLATPFPGTLAIVNFRIDNELYGAESTPTEDIEY